MNALHLRTFAERMQSADADFEAKYNRPVRDHRERYWFVITGREPTAAEFSAISRANVVSSRSLLERYGTPEEVYASLFGDAE